MARQGGGAGDTTVGMHFVSVPEQYYSHPASTTCWPSADKVIENDTNISTLHFTFLILPWERRPGRVCMPFDLKIFHGNALWLDLWKKRIPILTPFSSLSHYATYHSNTISNKFLLFKYSLLLFGLCAAVPDLANPYGSFGPAVAWNSGVLGSNPGWRGCHCDCAYNIAQNVQSM